MKNVQTEYDVFICHASEDKEFVRSLTLELLSHDLKVWFDEIILEIGDSLRKSIDLGFVT